MIEKTKNIKKEKKKEKKERIMDKKRINRSLHKDGRKTIQEVFMRKNRKHLTVPHPRNQTSY
jgi:hypothetical protein